nr:MAG: DNA polymerase B [Lokiarchaeota virus Ratatoskr Meg22_1012]
MLYLLNVVYDGKYGFFTKKRYSAKLKFYNDETQQIEVHDDHTNHHPNFIVDEKPTFKHHELYRIVQKPKIDRLHDKRRVMYKVFTKTPLGVPELSKKFKKAWENKIKYVNCYLDDRKLVPCMPYNTPRSDNYVQQQHDKEILNEIFAGIKDESDEFFRWLQHYLDMYLTTVPSVRRCGMDIEVAEEAPNKFPNPQKAKQPVLSTCIIGSDGKVYKFVNKELKEPPTDKCVHYMEEWELIYNTLKVCDSYPMTLTFNGDGFDVRYLRNRLRHLKKNINIPVYIDSDRFCHFRHSVHIDLQLFLQQGAIQKYAFKDTYKTTSLEACSQALFNVGKVKHDGLVRDLSTDELIKYNERDAWLTLYLTQFNNEVLLKLMFFAARINKCDLMLVTRKTAMTWLSARFSWIHRHDNILIPLKEDIEKLKGGASKKGKTGAKFSGAKVLEPVPGVFWNAVLVDFVSMYASIIKEYNISYETIMCGHEECKRKLPRLGYQICSKYDGIIATHLSLDLVLRKNYFKPKAKLTGNLMLKAIEQFIKVEVNMSWGIIGNDKFDYYCEPAAEGITDTGQFNLLSLRKEALNPTYVNSIPISKLRQLTCKTLYGHTDSCMLDNPHELMVEHLKNFCIEKLGLELDVEAKYLVVFLTSRKANYIGIEITKDGNKAVIKGLAGKKSNTPLLFQKTFKKVISLLEQIESKKTLPLITKRIIKVVKHTRKKIMTKNVTPEDISFNISMSKELNCYTKNIPQHVRAARLLKEFGEEVHSGDIISYIKCKNGVVQPVEFADVKLMDTKKYREQLESIFQPLFEPLQINYASVIEGRKQLLDF